VAGMMMGSGGDDDKIEEENVLYTYVESVKTGGKKNDERM